MQSIQTIFFVVVESKNQSLFNVSIIEKLSIGDKLLKCGSNTHIGNDFILVDFIFLKLLSETQKGAKKWDPDIFHMFFHEGMFAVNID